MLMNFKIVYFIFMIIPIFHLFYFQIKKLNMEIPDDCMSKFKSNNFLGLVIFINLLIGKIF